VIGALLALAVGVPTPSPTISPLNSAVVQWYAQRGADASGLDPALVRAVIDAESGGDPRAVSKAGAIGMMQLASATASDCGIHNVFDPLANVQCGSRTLGYLVHRYGVEEGIAAYNFGSGDVEATGNHLSKMPVETQQYVKAVIEEYDLLQHESLEAQAPDDAAPAAGAVAIEPIPVVLLGFAANVLGLTKAPPGCDDYDPAATASIAESDVRLSDLIVRFDVPRARRIDFEIEQPALVHVDRIAGASFVARDGRHVNRAAVDFEREGRFLTF